MKPTPGTLADMAWLVACADDSPDEDAPDTHPKAMSAQQRVTTMNQIGEDASPRGRWRYRLVSECVLYSVSLRQPVLVAPVVASLFSPVAGPAAAMMVVAVLLRMDRFQVTGAAVTAGVQPGSQCTCASGDPRS